MGLEVVCLVDNVIDFVCEFINFVVGKLINVILLDLDNVKFKVVMFIFVCLIVNVLFSKVVEFILILDSCDNILVECYYVWCVGKIELFCDLILC